MLDSSSFSSRDKMLSHENKSEAIDTRHSNLRPLTSLYTDLAGRSIQVWGYKNRLFAYIFKSDGSIANVCPKVTNCLNPNDREESLISRLESAKSKMWHLAYLPEKKCVTIWPFLLAAGRDQASGSPDPFQKKINNYKAHLKPGHHPKSDLKAAWREERGEVVARKKDGTPWDHRKEVRDAQRGLKNTIGKIKDELSKQISPERRAHLQKQLSEASKLLSYSEGYLRSQPQKAPGSKQFEQNLQQTKLTDSYNSTNRQNPVPPRASTGGDIGGVACGVDYLTGLFDSPTSFLERTHYFFLPDSERPFTDEELQQVIRELAVGIYSEGTAPFFSLHFNGDTNMYPVIHPVYKGTLVGRVVALLDYMMKGYLNGALFREDFVDNWHKNPNWSAQTTSAFQALIDLVDYCKEHLEGSDKEYQSHHARSEQSEIDEYLKGLSTLFDKPEECEQKRALGEFEGFSNSFRIISKQNEIKKSGPVWELCPDFDVFYTIVQSPTYKQYFAQYLRKEGKEPQSYAGLKECYELMCKKIHDHMVKLPVCKNLFSMLGVMGFLSSYLLTLKKHRIIPQLRPIQRAVIKECPPLFPYIPIPKKQEEDIRIEPRSLFNTIFAQGTIRDCLMYQLRKGLGLQPKIQEEKRREAKDAFQELYKEHILKRVSAPCARALRNSLLLERIGRESAGREFESLVGELFQLAEQARQRLGSHSIDPTKIPQLYEGIKNQLIAQQPTETLPLLNRPYSYQTPILSHEFGPDKLLVEHRIVGGCGLNMKALPVLSSDVGASIYQEKAAFLSELSDEKWTAIEGQNPGFIFRMELESMDPDWNPDTLSQAVFLEPGETVEDMEQKLALFDALQRRDLQDFSDRVDGLPKDKLEKMQDASGALLMHKAAAISKTKFREKLSAKGVRADKADLLGYLPIHYAAMSGGPDQVEAFCSAGHINRASANRATPLHVALQHCQEGSVALLVQKGAIWNTTSEGYTPLHTAVHAGNLTNIRALLNAPEARSHINTSNHEVGTALMMACESDSYEAVTELLNKDASSSIVRKDGMTAIEIAIVRKNVRTLTLLLRRAPLSTQATFVAAEHATSDIMKQLVQKEGFYVQKNSSKDTPLHAALRYGNLKAAEVIIDSAPSSAFLEQKNEEKETALDLCVKLGAWNLIGKLKAKGVSLSAEALLTGPYQPKVKTLLGPKQFTPMEIGKLLLIAAKAGNIRAIQDYLLTLDPQAQDFEGPKGWLLVHYLAKFDAIFLLKKRVSSSGDSLQRLQQDGNKTLPYIAAEWKSFKALAFLLEEMKNNNLSFENHFGTRHLFYPILEHAPLNICAKILNVNPFANIALDEKQTKPLHIAARRGRADLVNLLIEREADVTAADSEGSTPLSLSADAGAIDCLSLLLRNGAPITPFALYAAASSTHPESLEKLQQRPISIETRKKAVFLAMQKRDQEAFAKLTLGDYPFDEILDEGWTPLLYAASTGQKEIICFLLTKVGSDGQTRLQKTALDYAVSNRHLLCAHLLKEAGYPLTLPREEETHVQEALSRGPSPAKECLSTLQSAPLNHLFLIEAGGQLTGGGVLSLLFQLDPRTADQKVRRNLSQIPFNWTDENGNTLTHLYVYLRTFPSGIGQLNWTARNHQGATPLHLAAGRTSVETLSLIYDRCPALLEAKDNEGRTPLFYALEDEKAANATLFLEKGANPNHRTPIGITPLTVAIKKKSFLLTKKLIDFGADPNFSITAEEIPPVFLAVALEATEVVRTLLFQGADPEAESKGSRLIHVVAELKDPSLMRILLALGVSTEAPNQSGLLPIHKAAAIGNSENLHLLLSENPEQKDQPTLNEEKGNETPLTIATATGKSSTVEEILSWRPKLSTKNSSGIDALMRAAAQGSGITFSSLLNYQVFNESQALCDAVKAAIGNDSRFALEILIKKGVSPHAPLVHGHTPFHLACMRGSLECAELLLQLGVDPDQPNPNAETPLELAIENGLPSLLQLLLRVSEHDADFIGKNGQSLLHRAVEKQRISNLAALLTHGASVEKTNSAGELPVHVAARRGQKEAVILLLLCQGDGTTHRQGVYQLHQYPQDIQEVFTCYEQIVQEQTPGENRLHLAVRFGNLLATKVLLYLEPVTEKNEEGKTPLDLARALQKNDLILPLSEVTQKYSTTQE